MLAFGQPAAESTSGASMTTLSTRDFAPAKERGFTLLELMTALTVLAVLLAVGVPSFSDIARNNRSAANSNELVSAFAIARSEAIRRGARVTVCPSEDGEQCTNSWGAGWIVFSDDAANDNASPAVKEVLRIWSAPRGEPSVTTRTTGGAPAAVTWARFLPRGDVRTNGALPVVFRIEPEDCKGEQGRNIQLNAVGRTTVSRFSC